MLEHPKISWELFGGVFHSISIHWTCRFWLSSVTVWEMFECLKVTAGQEEGLQKDQLGYTYVEPDDYKHLWLDNDRLVVSNLASFSSQLTSALGMVPTIPRHSCLFPFCVVFIVSTPFTYCNFCNWVMPVDVKWAHEAQRYAHIDLFYWDFKVDIGMTVLSLIPVSCYCCLQALFAFLELGDRLQKRRKMALKRHTFLAETSKRQKHIEPHCFFCKTTCVLPNGKK